MTDDLTTPLQATLAELERLHHEATPAPWTSHLDLEASDLMAAGELIGAMMHVGDGELIAAMRNALPLLLRTIREQQEEIERLKQETLAIITTYCQDMFLTSDPAQMRVCLSPNDATEVHMQRALELME